MRLSSSGPRSRMSATGSKRQTAVADSGLMTKLASAVVAVLVIFLTLQPAAASSTRVLTVSSQGNGLVMLTFTHPVTFTEGWTLNGPGRYKTALLDRSIPRRAPDTSVSVLLWNNPGVSQDRGQLGAVADQGHMVMPPGTYRLYLSSDRPVTLRWPVMDYLGPISFTARPTKVQARLSSGAVSQATLPPYTTTSSHSYNQVDVLTFVQAHWDVQGSVGPSVDDAKICLRARGSQDCSGYGGQTKGVDTQLATHSTLTQSSIWEPFDVGFIGPATAEATFTGTGTHHATRHATLSIAFPV
jgi:hypothetical protein